jgi:hypothetical protein
MYDSRTWSFVNNPFDPAGLGSFNSNYGDSAGDGWQLSAQARPPYPPAKSIEHGCHIHPGSVSRDH